MTTNNLRQSRGGATLIETIIYTLIVAGVVSAFLLIIYSTIIISDRTQASINLVEEKMFIAQKLDWVLQSVNYVTTPAEGASGGTLTLTKLDFASNPLVVDVSGGALHLKSGAGNPITLTRSDTTITNFTVEHAAAAGRGRINVTMTIDNGSGSTSIDQIIFLK